MQASPRQQCAWNDSQLLNGAGASARKKSSDIFRVPQTDGQSASKETVSKVRPCFGGAQSLLESSARLSRRCCKFLAHGIRICVLSQSSQSAHPASDDEPKQAKIRPPGGRLPEMRAFAKPVCATLRSMTDRLQEAPETTNPVTTSLRRRSYVCLGKLSFRDEFSGHARIRETSRDRRNIHCGSHRSFVISFGSIPDRRFSTRDAGCSRKCGRCPIPLADTCQRCPR